MIYQFHFKGYTPKKWNQRLELIFYTNAYFLILFLFFILWHSSVGTGVSPTPLFFLQSFTRCLPSALRSLPYCHWGASRQCKGVSVVSVWDHRCITTTGCTSFCFCLWIYLFLLRFHYTSLRYNSPWVEKEKI